MATGGRSSTPSPRDPVTSLTDCPHCGSLCLGPSILPCGHLLCRKCVHNKVLQLMTAGCPKCQQPLCLPRDQDLSISQVIGQMGADPIMEHLVLQELEREGDIHCLNCPNKIAANVCLDCQDYYCEVCSVNHTRGRSTKGHVLQMLPQALRNTSFTASATPRPRSPSVLSTSSMDSIRNIDDCQSRGLSSDLSREMKWVKKTMNELEQSLSKYEEMETTAQNIASLGQQLVNSVQAHRQLLLTYHQYMSRLEATLSTDTGCYDFKIRGCDIRVKMKTEFMERRFCDIRKEHHCPNMEELERIEAQLTQLLHSAVCQAPAVIHPTPPPQPTVVLQPAFQTTGTGSYIHAIPPPPAHAQQGHPVPGQMPHVPPRSAGGPTGGGCPGQGQHGAGPVYRRTGREGVPLNPVCQAPAVNHPTPPPQPAVVLQPAGTGSYIHAIPPPPAHAQQGHPVPGQMSHVPPQSAGGPTGGGCPGQEQHGTGPVYRRTGREGVPLNPDGEETSPTHYDTPTSIPRLNVMTATPQRVSQSSPRTDQDSESPWIIAIVCLPDDRLVMTDRNNSKVKVMDVTPPHALSASTHIPETPLRLAVLPDGLVAMTTDKPVVYLMEVTSTVRVVSRIQTDRRYQGIAGHSDGLLIVSCGPSSEGPGAVHVMNRQGGLVRRLTEGLLELKSPLYFCQSGDQHILLSDGGPHVVHEIDVSSGHVTQTFRHTDMEGPQQVCVDSIGNVFVACYHTQCVMVRNRKGQWRKLLTASLHSDPWKTRPHGLCLTRSGHILVAWGKSVSDSVVICYKLT